MSGDQSSPVMGSSVHQDVLRWSGVFQARELEAQYRQQQLRHDKPLLRIFIILIILGGLVFTLSDYLLFGITTPFWWLVATRALLILASLLILVGLSKAAWSNAFDRMLLGWSVVVVACVIYIDATRPANFTGQALVTVLLVFALYTAYLVPPLLQTIPALLLSLGNLGLVFWFKPAGEKLTAIAVTTGLIIANLLGAVGAVQLNRWKRQQFAGLLRETELRVSVEQAMTKIRTLRGIIPICAHCKQVRMIQGTGNRSKLMSANTPTRSSRTVSARTV